MKNVIIIREFRRETDNLACKELLRNSIMSHLSSAFYTFLFKEIILQIMVLVAAVFFIFLGFPVSLCLATIPFIAAIVFVLTYLTHSVKASQVLQLQHKKCWVAEACEPYFMNTEPSSLKYGIFNENEYKSEEINTQSMCKKIVGVINLRDYYGPNNSLWLYGLAVDSKYQRKGIARKLVKNVIDFGKQREYDSLELVTTDLQNEARLVFQYEGFQLKQIYHRQLFGLVPMGKYQMGLLLHHP